ncbi:MAG: HI0074 family nucleotidyltransferase substrate-binding subunit [Sulfuricaulis sp.]
MSERWYLDDFGRAVEQLESALNISLTNDVIKAGCIQYFEFCFELAWKSIKFVSADEGLPECASPKICLRQAFSQGWIDSEDSWLMMLDARNRMSHTYNAKDALNVYELLPLFLPEFKTLCHRLGARK